MPILMPFCATRLSCHGFRLRELSSCLPSFPRPSLQTTKPPAGGFASDKSILPLRVLLAPPRLVQAHLLALDRARVTRYQPRLLESRLERRVVLDQRPRDAVAHRARLAGFAPTVHVDSDVEIRRRFRDLEWLAHDHAPGFAREKHVDRLAVYGNGALAGRDEDPRYGRLAAAGAVILLVALQCHGSPGALL